MSHSTTFRCNLAYGPSVQTLPDISLDEFRICIYKLFDAGELVYYSWAMFFGTLQPSKLYGYPSSGFLIYPASGISVRCGISDVLVFSIILVKTRRPRMNRYPGIPSILDVILRDATHYFVLISSAHLLSLLFLFVTSVCDAQRSRRKSVVFCSSCVHFQAEVELLPAMRVPSFLDIERLILTSTWAP